MPTGLTPLLPTLVVSCGLSDYSGGGQKILSARCALMYPCDGNQAGSKAQVEKAGTHSSSGGLERPHCRGVPKKGLPKQEARGRETPSKLDVCEKQGGRHGWS